MTGLNKSSDFFFCCNSLSLPKIIAPHSELAINLSIHFIFLRSPLVFRYWLGLLITLLKRVSAYSRIEAQQSNTILRRIDLLDCNNWLAKNQEADVPPYQEQELREQRQSVNTALDETRENIRRSIDEARSQIPNYTQAINEYQEHFRQALFSFCCNVNCSPIITAPYNLCEPYSSLSR